MSPTIWLTSEPPRFTLEHIKNILIQAYCLSASDVTLQSQAYIFVEHEGKFLKVTQRRLSHAEVTDILNGIYGLNGSAQILSGCDVNTYYEFTVSRNERYRFRVNGTGCLVEGQEGIQLSFRVIPSTPPKLSALSLEYELIKGLTPDQGVVYVTGATGSGKSTLLAAIIRDLVERVDSHRKIVTYESPIEFTYDRLKNSNVMISQSEIPRHIKSYPEAVVNALRRNPSLILIGEAPDPITIQAVIKAGLTGHPVYTTLHSSGVAETMRRLVTAWPIEAGIGPIIDVLETVRVIIWQQLVPTIEGKRIALREFLIFDEAIRHQLLETAVKNITLKTRQLLEIHGQPMWVDAQRKFEAGLISKQVYTRFQKSQLVEV